MVNHLISYLGGCEGYIDDVIVHSERFEAHLLHIRSLFERLTKANLTVSLMKTEFRHAVVEYLGHIVGNDQVKPVKAKVEAIVNFSTPTCKELMRFLGMAGYYWKFCPNFSSIAYPLTNLLCKNSKFLWGESCQNAFEQIKAILTVSPVLSSPDFGKEFMLQIDASDVGCGGVLLQNDSDSVSHPIAYFSKKFDKYQRNYSTIEKECLAILLSLQHFDVYVSSCVFPIVIFTDHNPLVFLQRMQNKNQRLMRWSLALQAFNIVIKHIKGSENLIADAL